MNYFWNCGMMEVESLQGGHPLRPLPSLQGAQEVHAVQHLLVFLGDQHHHALLWDHLYQKHQQGQQGQGYPIREIIQDKNLLKEAVL